MIRLLILPLLLFLLPACAPAFASASDFPSHPHFQISLGLERPQNLASPGPYIEVTWDRPNIEAVTLPEIDTREGEYYQLLSYGVALEIYDTGGQTRAQNSSAGNWQLLWAFNSHDPESSERMALWRAGCTVDEQHIRITGDCLDRFQTQNYFSWGGDFPDDFLVAGGVYEIRVYSYYRFWAGDLVYESLLVPGIKDEHFTPIHIGSIPLPVAPTSPPPTILPTLLTPRPTPTPWPTAVLPPAPSPADRAFNPYDEDRDGIIDVNELLDVLGDFFNTGVWR